MGFSGNYLSKRRIAFSRVKLLINGASPCGCCVKSRFIRIIGNDYGTERAIARKGEGVFVSFLSGVRFRINRIHHRVIPLRNGASAGVNRPDGAAERNGRNVGGFSAVYVKINIAAVCGIGVDIQKPVSAVEAAFISAAAAQLLRN